MIKTFHKGIATLAGCFNIDITPISKVWSRVYLSRLQSRGKKDAVKFMKELNLAVERYALHQTIEPIPWTKSDKDNFPSVISKVKPYLRSENPLTVMFTISVFRTVESLRLPISKDISTVISPCQADDLVVNDVINFIPGWVKRLPPLNLPELKYHLTVKNGPNGPALIASDSDIKSLMNEPKLFEAIQVAQTQQNDKDQMEYDEIHPSVDSPIHSKLTQFPEKAGKTRTIAIIDYYSQRCLHPLHKGLMQMLANLVSDGTYSHLHVGKYAEQLTKDKSFIGCADLSSATDRFPALIQKKLLLSLVPNSNLANSLWTLLAERTFTVAWSGEQVTYQCGQPMGAHASWPLFALAHHLVVEYAGYNANVRNTKSKYRLIGDDVIISDKGLWQEYIRIMKALGLTINVGKTVESPRNERYSCAEVAKQLYLNGICLTPITPGFISNLKKPHMFNECVGILQNRYGESFKSVPYPTLINGFYYKSRTRKLVWLLSSNPISGIIKPTDVGYDENSPWVPIPIGQFLDEYKDVLAKMLMDSAAQELAKALQWLMTGQGTPWEAWTHPQPKALRRAFKATMNDLSSVQNQIKISFFNGDVSKVLDAVSFIPRPETPYMERTELRCRRTSNVIKRLYDLITM